MSFHQMNPYLFKMNGHVVLQHSSGEFIRVNPRDLHKAESYGDKDEFAQWHAEKAGDVLLLKSCKSGEYLRVTEHRTVDVCGEGGKWCEFRVHPQGNPGCYKLESAHHHGVYLAVRHDQVTIGEGGPFCAMTIFQEDNDNSCIEAPMQRERQLEMEVEKERLVLREKELQLERERLEEDRSHHIMQHQSVAEKYSQPYLFMQSHNVVLQHPGGQTLRVENGHLDAHGGKGELAHWYCEKNGDIAKLKNLRSGHYLKMENGHISADGKGGKWCDWRLHPVEPHEQNGCYLFESVHNRGSYLSVKDESRIEPGIGGNHCHILIFRE